MHKFLRVFVIIIIFFACLALGIYLAEFSLPEKTGPEPTQIIESNNQVRLLVLMVDELSSDNPELLSVWSVVLYYPEPKGIIFVPLSNPFTANYKNIQKAFDLTESYDPDPELLKDLQKQFRTRWEGSVVLDKAAMSILVQWLTNGNYSPGLQNMDIEQITEDNYFNNIQQICAFMRSSPANSLENLNWSTLVPEHFRTNLPFDKVMATWQNLIGSSAPLCDLINIDQ